MDSARLHGVWRPARLVTAPPRRRHSIVQQLFHRLGGRISELSRSGDLNLLATHWLAGLGEPKCRHDFARRFASVQSAHPPCVVREMRLFSWRQLLTNEGSAPSSTSQFDLVINNVGRLRGRQRQPCKHRDIARGFGVFQGNLCSASRTTYGYVPGQPEHAGLSG